MELIINTHDLSKLKFVSQDGEVYRLIKEVALDDAERRLEELTKNSKATLVTQKELMKRYKCGQERIKKWVSWGLHEIKDGRRLLYDLNELEELLKSRKI